ncbi:MAG: hypothetical protein HQM09_13740 [Candidatus Riflebacteria bacterium]|nr:hypothetical protein [Candidatus Riflebacteria bacterium]
MRNLPWVFLLFLATPAWNWSCAVAGQVRDAKKFKENRIGKIDEVVKTREK